MKTINNKLKFSFLLALIAAVICCVSISFAGIFGVKETASADVETADAETTETADNAFIMPSYVDTFNLGGDCSQMGSRFYVAVKRSDEMNNWVKVQLKNDWIADSDSMYGTSFGAGSSDGRIYIPGPGDMRSAQIILDLNGHVINRGLTSARSRGSVIYVKGSLIVMDSSTSQTGLITGGYSMKKAGGIYVEDGDLTILSGNISGNKTLGHGGGVTVEEFADFDMYGGNITGNYADGNGGGIYANYCDTFLIAGGNISGNYAYNGGGVRVDDCGFEMSGGTISGNRADGAGGGVVYNGESDDSDYFSMQGGSISGNYAGEDGGGVCVREYSFMYFSGGVISDNVSVRQGGGIRLEQRCRFKMIGTGIISGNRTLEEYSYGGGICSNSELEIDGGSVTGNTTEMKGGGIWCSQSSYIKNCIISGNSALRKGRGQDDIWVGGGVYCADDLVMDGCTVSDNYANGNGGGIASPDWASIENCQIINNTAVGHGGGVAASSSLTLKNCTVSFNKVKGQHHGGGVYMPYDSSGGSGLWLEGTVFIQYNELAQNVHGSGIYCYGSISGEGANVSYNKVGKSGIWAYDYIDLKNGIVSYNDGYGIQSYGGHTITLTNMIIASNKSDGVNGIVDTLKDCTITNNGGDGIWGGIISASGSLISGNGDSGLHICSGNSTRSTTFTNCRILNNRVGVYVSGNTISTLSVTNCDISNNTSNGLTILRVKNITLDHCTVTNNGDMGVWVSDGSREESLSQSITVKGGSYVGNDEGIGVDWNSKFYVSGALDVSNNRSSDIYFDWGPDGVTNKILINGALEENVSDYASPKKAHIGLHSGGDENAESYVYTTGFNTYNSGKSPSEYFFSKSVGYDVYKYENEVLVSKTAPTLAWKYKTDSATSYASSVGKATVTYTGEEWDVMAEYSVINNTFGAVQGFRWYRDGQLIMLSNYDPRLAGYYVAILTDDTTEWANPEFTLIITKKQITAIGGVTASDKAYDGITAANVTVSGATFEGKYGSDTLTLAYTSATFANATAGDNKTVTLSGLSLGGSSADNYELASSVTVTATASIKKAQTAVKWTNTSLDYTGTAQGPKATYKTVDGTETEITMLGGVASATNAGDYKASVPANTNYEFVNNECDWTINKVAPTVNAKLTGATGLQVGDAMPEISTTEGDTAGTIVWINNALKQGTNKYGWVFIPSNTANYLTATGEVELEVSAATGVSFKGIKAVWEQTKSIPSETELSKDNIGDFGTLSVKETYSDGTEVTILPADYTLSIEGGKLAAGSNKITVTYTFGEGEEAEDYTAEFTVFVLDDLPEVEDPVLTGITAIFSQTKMLETTTEVTLEKLAEFGTLTVKTVYDDKSEKVLAAGFTLKLPEGGLVEGANEITVIYTVAGEGEEAEPVEYTATFTVFVVDNTVPDPVLEDIFVSFTQNKNIPTTVNINSLGNYGDLIVKELYDTGAEKNVTAGYTLKGPEGGLKVGANVITLTYTVGTGDEAQTFTKTFTIFVTETFVTGITATYTPSGDVYASTALDELRADITVVANYNDGTEALTITSYTLSVSGGKLVIGSNTVVVTYTTSKGEFKDVITVTVVPHEPEVKSIEASATQTSPIYSSTKLEELAEKLNLTVTATDGDGLRSELAASEYELTAFNAETGEVTVALKSNAEITATFNVFVTPKAITKITVAYTQGITVIYPDYDIADLKERVEVKVHYNDGSEPVKLTEEQFDIAGNLAIGTSTITVSYEAEDGETYYGSFTVTVIAKPDGSKTPAPIHWENTSFVFDGNAHAPVAYYYIDGGKYEVILKITISGDNLSEDGTAVNVGKYRALVDETSVKEGYELTGEIFKDFTITEAKVNVTWSNEGSDTYDGNAHTPTFKASAGVDDKTVKFDVVIVPAAGSSVSTDEEGNAIAVNAGEYVAKLVVTDGANYKVEGETEYRFTIAKAKLSKQPENGSVNTSKKFSTLNAAVEYVKGLYGDKVSVKGIENEEGGFDISVSIVDKNNYEWEGAEGGVEPVKFSFAYVAPNQGGSGFVLGTTETIVISAVLAVAGLIAIIAFILAITKRKGGVAADSDGFYEAYTE